MASARVETARALTDSERHGLKAALESALGHEADLDVRPNEALIAGVRVRVNGTLIDGSVAGALDRLATRFVRKS